MTESALVETGGRSVSPSRQGWVGLIRAHFLGAEKSTRATERGNKQSPH